MSNVKGLRLLIIVVIIVLALQIIYFYRGVYRPTPVEMHDFNITPPISQTGKFTDTPGKGSGLVLIDNSHDNKFTLSELDTLLSRILSRGASFETLSDSGKLGEKLKEAKAYIVIAPENAYSAAETKEVKDFVKKGGKLLLIADPSRESEINSLAGNFKVLFWNDYLYNLYENDGNYQYIYLREFTPSIITTKLEKIALYSACSISPGEKGIAIAIADRNTHSSKIETQANLSPLVLIDEKILAIGDFTFMLDPYNSLWDNSQLVSSIADFLTGVEEKTAPPKIVSWYNNKTKDSSTNISIANIETIFFNATADQQIENWSWTLNEEEQSHNFDNLTYTFKENGLFYINVSARNSNGSTQTVSWRVNATIQ